MKGYEYEIKPYISEMNDIISIHFTNGSNGYSKAVSLTNKNILANI